MALLLLSLCTEYSAQNTVTYYVRGLARMLGRSENYAAGWSMHYVCYWQVWKIWSRTFQKDSIFCILLWRQPVPNKRQPGDTPRNTNKQVCLRHHAAFLVSTIFGYIRTGNSELHLEYQSLRIGEHEYLPSFIWDYMLMIDIGTLPLCTAYYRYK